MGKKNKRQKTKVVSYVLETEEGVKASSTGIEVDDEGGDSSPLIALRKRGRPRKIAAEKGEEEDDEGEMGGVRKKKENKEEKKKDEQQVKEEDSTRSRARRKSIPRKSS